MSRRIPETIQQIQTKMKLNKYIKGLQEIAKKYPNATVITASDEEGNNFSEVEFAPTPGHFSDGDFYSDEEDMKEQDLKINAVCVN